MKRTLVSLVIFVSLLFLFFSAVLSPALVLGYYTGPEKCPCFFGVEIVNNQGDSDRYLNEIAILRPGELIPLSVNINPKIRIRSLFTDRSDQWICEAVFSKKGKIWAKSLIPEAEKNVIKDTFYFKIPRTEKYVKIESVSPKVIHILIGEHTP